MPLLHLNKVQFNTKHVGRVNFTILDDIRSMRRLFPPFLLEEMVNFSLFFTFFHPQMFIKKVGITVFILIYAHGALHFYGTLSQLYEPQNKTN